MRVRMFRLTIIFYDHITVDVNNSHCDRNTWLAGSVWGRRGDGWLQVAQADTPINATVLELLLDYFIERRFLLP